MSAQASHDEQMLLDQLDHKVINLFNMISAFNESDKLAARDFSLMITVLNHHCKEAVM